jgi:hypothetical protein
MRYSGNIYTAKYVAVSRDKIRGRYIVTPYQSKPIVRHTDNVLVMTKSQFLKHHKLEHICYGNEKIYNTRSKLFEPPLKRQKILRKRNDLWKF